MSKRLEARAEMARELYLQASFFKMQTIGSPSIDRTVNILSGAQVSFTSTRGGRRFFPPKDKMPKFPKGK